MPVDPTWVGKPFPYPMSYIVGVEKIRNFAEAIGDDNPIYWDRAAARAAGHADLVAPPTFGVSIITRAQDDVSRIVADLEDFDPEGAEAEPEPEAF